MDKLLNISKVPPTRGRNSETFAGPGPVIARFLKYPRKAYNAVFTPMGRRNLFFFIKKMRLRLNSSYRKNGTQIYALLNGSRFVVHRGDRLSEQIYLEGAYESLEALVVSKIVHRGDVVMDIGANVGYYTSVLDTLVKPNGRVHSFEPGFGTFHRLEETKTLLHLDQAVLHQKAISDSVGQIEFWLSLSGSDAQQATHKHVGLGMQTRAAQVEATTLDAFIGELNAHRAQSIAFVKCDIEGEELSMLKGAGSLLNAENPPIWLIEHNRTVLWAHGCSSAQLLSYFKDANVFFVPMCWPPSLMVVNQVSKWNGVPDDLPDECNLLIFPKRGIYSSRVASLQQAGLIAG
jgi:FkbM family methyltransferase